jgi:hypothetical protein
MDTTSSHVEINETNNHRMASVEMLDCSFN